MEVTIQNKSILSDSNLYYLSEVSSHGSQEWILALSASSMEIVHSDVPNHASTETLLLDVLHLVLDGLETVITDPLVSLVSVRPNCAGASFNFRPTVLQVQTDLIVPKEALGPGPFPAIPPSLVGAPMPFCLGSLR